MKISVEKHMNIDYVVVACRDDNPKIRKVIAHCPSESIALTIKGLYEEEEYDAEYLAEK